MQEKKGAVTTKEFVTALWQGYCKQYQITEQALSIKELLFLGRQEGWLEAMDEAGLEEVIERRHAARILHMFGKRVLQQEDGGNWERARVLKDLYDCRACVCHVAEMYEQGIMEAFSWINENDKKFPVFGMREKILPEEMKGMIMRLLKEDLEGGEARMCSFQGQNDLKKSKQKEPLPGESQRQASAEYLSRQEIDSMLSKGEKFVLVNVQAREQSEEDAIWKNAIWIPMGKILQNPDCMKAYRRDRICLFCELGYQSRIAANCLLEHGYEKVSYTASEIQER